MGVVGIVGLLCGDKRGPRDDRSVKKEAEGGSNCVRVFVDLIPYLCR